MLCAALCGGAAVTDPEFPDLVDGHGAGAAVTSFIQNALGDGGADGSGSDGSGIGGAGAGSAGGGPSVGNNGASSAGKPASLADFKPPVYSQSYEKAGKVCVDISAGPFFQTADKVLPYGTEMYGPLDKYGRATSAVAVVGKETMPAEGVGRQPLDSVDPSGWHLVTYDRIEGGFLYNRCHLIAWTLTGEGANANNLITGTRCMNMEGMLPIEQRVSSFVHRTGKHVLYRVTPYFSGKNLLADGVLMEAMSLEDRGKSLSICTYCFNIEPGFVLNYTDGSSRLAADQEEPICQYVLNTHTKKIHLPSCSTVQDLYAKNRADVQARKSDLLAKGYSCCGYCRP